MLQKEQYIYMYLPVLYMYLFDLLINKLYL